MSVFPLQKPKSQGGYVTWHNGVDLMRGGTKMNPEVRIPDAVLPDSRTGQSEQRASYLVAGRVVTRVKNTDGSASTCSPRERFL